MFKLSKMIFKFFKKIHLIAFIIIFVYFLLSQFNLSSALNQKDLLSFVQVFVFSLFFFITFLFMFSHDDFFKFIKDLEKIESKGERKIIDRYHNHRIIVCMVIGSLFGPIAGSLAIRIALNKYKNKYLLTIPMSILYTLFLVILYKFVLN